MSIARPWNTCTAARGSTAAVEVRGYERAFGAVGAFAGVTGPVSLFVQAGLFRTHWRSHWEFAMPQELFTLEEVRFREPDPVPTPEARPT